jgi:hypothetical protein
MGNIKIIKGVFDTKLGLEHVGIKAGFPSPADPERPAVLGEGTHDYFYYENVNECGYGFSAHFFKKFVVLKSTTKYETFGCFGMGVAFDGVYIKVKQ